MEKRKPFEYTRQENGDERGGSSMRLLQMQPSLRFQHAMTRESKTVEKLSKLTPLLDEIRWKNIGDFSHSLFTICKDAAGVAMEKYLIQHLDEELRHLQSVTQQMEECIHSKNHEVDRLLEVILRADEGRKNSTNQILSGLATTIDKINSFEGQCSKGHVHTSLAEINMEKDAKQFQMNQSNVGEVKTNVMTSIECVDGKPVNNSESEVKFVSDLKRSGNGIDGVEIRRSQKSLSACKLSVSKSSFVKGVSDICTVGQDTNSGLDVLGLLKEKNEVGPFKVNVALVDVEMDKIISYLFEKSLKSSDILVDTEFHQLERYIFQTLAPSQNINGEIINIASEMCTHKRKDSMSKTGSNWYLTTWMTIQSKFTYSKKSQRSGGTSNPMRSFFLGDLALCEKIFVPVHVRSEDHWILLIVKMKGIIEIWDSLHGGKSVGNEILKESLHGGNKWSFTEFEVIMMDVPQQPNTFDCGIYVINFMEERDTQFIVPLIDNERMRVAWKIFSSSFNKKERKPEFGATIGLLLLTSFRASERLIPCCLVQKENVHYLSVGQTKRMIHEPASTNAAAKNSSSPNSNKYQLLTILTYTLIAQVPSLPNSKDCHSYKQGKKFGKAGLKYYQNEFCLYNIVSKRGVFVNRTTTISSSFVEESTILKPIMFEYWWIKNSASSNVKNCFPTKSSRTSSIGSLKISNFSAATIHLSSVCYAKQNRTKVNWAFTSSPRTKDQVFFSLEADKPPGSNTLEYIRGGGLLERARRKLVRVETHCGEPQSSRNIRIGVREQASQKLKLILTNKELTNLCGKLPFPGLLPQKTQTLRFNYIANFKDLNMKNQDLHRKFSTTNLPKLQDKSPFHLSYNNQSSNQNSVTPKYSIENL
ncbi:hypothetical protein F8388_005996 [Cannabis sativa]|uniref:Ubiquitin-like protease family profile domain-containing protein n=1 Tax=Cannabis sativa TaxID=3483 RepID=A0A7J6H7S6_CANSA|nr:hypothetical protein F8388_005996 [Cannabis sativa]